MAWYDIFDSGDDFGGYDSQDEYDYYETDNGDFDQGFLESSFLGGGSVDDYLYEYDDSAWLDEPQWVSKEDNQGLGNTLGRYTGTGSFLGGLLGGDKGSLGGSDLAGYGRNAFDAYMGKRDNDRYNEMMQPMTDLYRDQAADVRNRRANRDTNLASEWEIASGLMQPGRDRMDQRADNLRQHQGKTQSSSGAWDKAANLQTRELTDLASRQQLADAYDKRTGTLGGQLSGYNPMLDGEGKINTGYLDRQENPYLGMLSSSITG